MSDAKKGGKRVLKAPNDPKLEAVAGFLCLDALALTAFGFGGYTGLLFLRVIGVCLAVLIIPYFRYHLSKMKSDFSLIGALVAFVFLSFSYYWLTYSSNLLYGLLLNLIVCAGYVAFFLIGASVKRLPRLKQEYIALALLGGLALLVLITGAYSLIRYGAFYVTRYAGQVYYFDGSLFPISSEGKVLDGFLFRETSLSFAKIPSFLLACSGAGLIALRPKGKNSWRFFVLLGFAFIGLLDLALAPYLIGLLLLIPVYLVLGIHYLFLRFMSNEDGAKKRRKIAKVVFIVLIAIVALGLLILFIDTFMGENGFLKKIPLFYANGSPRRLGRLLETMENAVSVTFFSTSGGVRSFNILSTLFGANAVSGGNSLTYVNTSIFEFNVLYQNGLIGFLGLMFLIFFGIYHGWHYIERDEEPICRKFAMVAILLGFFLYFSILDNEAPLIHAYKLDEFFSYHTSLLVPLTRSSYILLAAFLLGYIYTPKPKENAEIHAKPADFAQNLSCGIESEVSAHE